MNILLSNNPVFLGGHFVRVFPLERGAWGGSQHRNTAKKINEHRITARKVNEIPSPQVRNTYF